MFIIEISYNVLHVWHCMELYDKKFFIYGNCMIKSFGHLGMLILNNLLVNKPSVGMITFTHNQQVKLNCT